jgi:hypothetical protein
MLGDYALKVSIDYGSEKSLLFAGDTPLMSEIQPSGCSPSPASLALRCLSGSGLHINAVSHQYVEGYVSRTTASKWQLGEERASRAIEHDKFAVEDMAPRQQIE